MNSNLLKAVEVFNQGGIVIFPTDTVWGIGCRLDQPKSIEKLFRIRKRPLTQAVPILVSGIKQACDYFQKLSPDKEALLKKYWPGGLTVVYHCQRDKIPSFARAGGTTIGLRMPNHSDLLTIINKLGVPILGPSANFHNKPTPLKFSDLDQDLVKLVDYVLPGESRGEKSSTVVDVTKQPWQILRQGPIVLNNI